MVMFEKVELVSNPSPSFVPDVSSGQAGYSPLKKGEICAVQLSDDLQNAHALKPLPFGERNGEGLEWRRVRQPI
jgi:hypothetical protein